MKSKIEQMIGNSYQVGNQVIEIKDIRTSKDPDMYRVITPDGEIKATADELINDYIQLKVVKQELPAEEKAIVIRNLDTNLNKMEQLADILFNNITQVKENPEYVPQAKSINESAKQLIELRKTQIEMIKVAKSF